MGHTRLGSIPKTRKWRAVVDMIAGGRNGSDTPGGTTALAKRVEPVSRQTIEAAQAALDKAIDDDGLRYTFYLLTQLVLSARERAWQAELEPLGIHLASDATIFDLTSLMQAAIDDFLSASRRPTDVSEMAQQAAGEALTALAGPRAVTLFGSGRDELQQAVRELSTKKGFSELGQRFFGQFMARFLNFYLSRVTAAQADGHSIHQVGDITSFNEALQAHCYQSARIVRDFCGEWYSKTEFQQGINLDNTSRFMAVAIKKLQAELQQQAEP